MADLGSSDYDEIDAGNSSPLPNGFPVGMPPSGVGSSSRANMGAEKRFWNRINPVKTTGGSGSAYTLVYDQAATAYYDGEIYSFVAHATNAAGATNNVDGLGAKALRLFGGNLLAGAIVTDQINHARYNSAAGAFDLIPQNGWVRLGSQSPSGASAVDFDDIPAGVNHLMLVGDVTPSVDGAEIGARTAGADGNYDSGAGDYGYIFNALSPAGTPGTVSAGTNASIPLANSVDNGSWGHSIRLQLWSIQRAKRTQYEFDTHWLTTASNAAKRSGSGTRAEDAAITGLRVFADSGTLTGTLTLLASV
jgi:hypothetical protein